MAKGLAVISGSNSVVFKALENGTIVFGQDVAASVTLSGSLKLDIEGKGANKFLTSDADGNATWVQVSASQVSYGQTNVSSALAALSASSAGDFASLEARISIEEVAHDADILSLDTRIDTLVGGDLGDTLNTIASIQEFLDGDGAGELISGIGDLTSTVNELTGALSAEEAARIAGDTALSGRLDTLEGATITVSGSSNEIEVKIDAGSFGTDGNFVLDGNHTITLGLPDDVTIGNDLTVSNDLTVEGFAEVKGRFRAPKLDRAVAEALYSLGNDAAYDGEMFYLNDVDGSGIFPQGKKWYFCENGQWHASPFYAEEPVQTL